MIPMERKCSCCKIIKELSNFYKSKSMPLGHSYECKVCATIKERARKEKRCGKKEVIKDGYKECSVCKVIKPKTEFYSAKSKKAGVQADCIVCYKSRAVYFKSNSMTIQYLEENLAIERWADVFIDGEEYNYKISDCGRVFLKKISRMGKPSYDKRGYPQICVSKNDKKKSRRIHTLVATHFIDNPNKLPQVNHKDGNKLNPHYSNLEWSSGVDNARHAVETGLWKPPPPEERVRNRKVIDESTGIVYYSIGNAQEKLGIKNLSRQLSGERPNSTTLKYYIP